MVYNLMAVMLSTTAMVSAGMAFPMMMLTVMVALYIGVIFQVACQQCLHCLIRIARNATV